MRSSCVAGSCSCWIKSQRSFLYSLGILSCWSSPPTDPCASPSTNPCFPLVGSIRQSLFPVHVLACAGCIFHRCIFHHCGYCWLCCDLPRQPALPILLLLYELDVKSCPRHFGDLEGRAVILNSLLITQTYCGGGFHWYLWNPKLGCIFLRV